MVPAPAFPLSREEFDIAIHPTTMINNYKGYGGSSPAQVQRMLHDGLRQLEADRIWLTSMTKHVADQDALLDAEFARLLQPSSSHS
jgi:hypothetical protein